MLQQKTLPAGQIVTYICGDGDPGLLWFAECIEQAKWPTDHDGQVRGEPTDLDNTEHTHHADAFGYVIEGVFGASGDSHYAVVGKGSIYRPATAGIRDMQF
jgi:hypothetical protein